MNIKYFFFIVFTFFFSVQHSFSQNSPMSTKGQVISVVTDHQKINIKTTNAFAEIAVYTPSVIRVRINNKPFKNDFSYVVQTTAEQPSDTLYLHVYNGSEANRFIYDEDDGKSFAYKKEEFYKRLITFDPEKKTITFAPAEGAYSSHFKYIKLMKKSENEY